MSVIRWVFEDTETSESVRLPLNPKEMSSPFPARELAFAWTAHAEQGIGRARIFDRTRSTPVEWSFGGVILYKSHYDLLLDWAQRMNLLRVTDHLGRTFEIIIQSLDVRERQRTMATQEWRADYTMTCLLLKEV